MSAPAVYTMEGPNDFYKHWLADESIWKSWKNNRNLTTSQAVFWHVSEKIMIFLTQKTVSVFTLHT